MRLSKSLIPLALAIGIVTPASGQVLISGDAPALIGSTVVDFQSFAVGTALSYTEGNVTFSGSGGLSVRVQNTFQGLFSTVGQYLDNNAGGTQTLRFDFANSVSAFGIRHGAADAGLLSLFVYAANGTLIGTGTSAPTVNSNVGAFIGWSDAGGQIAYAELRVAPTAFTAGGYDWVLFDDFEYVTADPSVVPEPASMILLGTGLFGIVGVGAKRRRKKAGVTTPSDA